MSFLKGIEGDYIETKNDNLIFDVKGFLHPKDRKICFIRFYPTSQGDRVRNGKYYKKIYNLKQRYQFLKDNFPKYLFYSIELDLELQGVRNEDIKKIYTPRENLKRLKQESQLSNLERNSKELCELFISEGNILEDSVGITGSSMVGLAKIDSDIDLIIYGTEISLSFQKKLEMIFQTSKRCRKYNSEEYKSHYKWRASGSNVSYEDFIKSESRKLHQGKFRGTDFFIRYIKSPKDWIGSYDDYKFKNYGRILIKCEITNATNSIFTPCSYKINVLKVLDSSQILGDINFNEITEINSFRGRFCEQAIKGEKVLVEGKLERISFKDKEIYFRILLGAQVQDKMIILNN